VIQNQILKNTTTHPGLFMGFCLYLCLPVLLFLPFIPGVAGGKMKESKPALPKTVGLWTRPDSPRMVNTENIFDYMDGAGELYIGYCFDHLESYEYEAKSQKNILVELYFMKTSDDAFGLLSLDWGGESIDLGSSSLDKTASAESQWPRALYGEGLLRIWSDNIYARIMAYQETAESREAVLTLGRTAVKGRHNPPSPELLKHLPASFQPGWKLRTDRISYFHSYLVLNSIYYLSQENILDLNLETEALTALYEKKEFSQGLRNVRLLLVRYPDSDRAGEALLHFHRVYLPDHTFQKESASSGVTTNVFPVEDGWLGYALQNTTITFIFECPDRETAMDIMDRLR